MSNGIDLITLALARKGGGGSDTAKELIVTATVNADNTVTIDKTYTEIDNAYTSNKNIRILATLNSPRRVVEFNSVIKQGTSYIFGTYENNAYLKITMSASASIFARVASQNLTAGTNIDITNNVISSNQPTAVNPFTLSFGNDDYNGSAPKEITAEKIGAATEDFVNSSIATNTAFFKGTFNSVSALPTEDVTNNDYAFVVGEDEAGNTTYTRYKYNSDDAEWIEEYVLNNSSFTAEQWATIQSGITEDDVTQIETNKDAIADLTANMPDSPEDINAQPKSLIIEADFDGENITVTDSRYVSGGTVDYSQLYSDSMTAFNGGTDVVLRVSVGDDIVVDLKCNCFVVGVDGSQLVFEGHNVAAVIVVAMTSSSVNVVAMYDIEPSDSLEDADDGQLTTAGAQKDYFQTKITSSNKIAYSNISGTPTLATVATSGSYNDLSNKPSLKTVATSGNYNDLSNKPTIPTVPSNLILGYSSSGSATAYNIQVVSALPTSPSATMIYLVTG